MRGVEGGTGREGRWLGIGGEVFEKARRMYRGWWELAVVSRSHRFSWRGWSE